MNKEKCIYVYADWLTSKPALMGKLYAEFIRNNEIFSFEYADSWIANIENNAFPLVKLDPDLPLYKGRQYLPEGKKIFGMFSDSCPDRWGRLLMKRREAIIARKEDRKPEMLNESDFLLGVNDLTRMGGLRFSLREGGEFLSHDRTFSVPPWTTLRSLEAFSIAFESKKDENEEKWLRQLIIPGSSLGGARPKATVEAPDGSLWIAKFPSKNDEWNSGVWEMIVHELALKCNIRVPEAKLEKYSENGSTFLIKRFDRHGAKRIHYASAMTLLSKTDDISAKEASYLDIVNFIKSNGANPVNDLKELWCRIVFTMAVSNTDDHLRNHGFILTNDGWILSPMFDVNPNIYGKELSLNVSEDDNSISFSLALTVAKYFNLKDVEAKNILEKICDTVDHEWKPLAEKYDLNREQIIEMEPAFDRRFKQ